jgi:hypothetical protein
MSVCTSSAVEHVHANALTLYATAIAATSTALATVVAASITTEILGLLVAMLPLQLHNSGAHRADEQLTPRSATAT